MGDLARVNTNIAALKSFQTLTSINNRILKRRNIFQQVKLLTAPRIVRLTILSRVL